MQGLIEFIKEKFNSGHFKSITDKEIFKKLNIRSSFEKKEITKTLNILENDGFIVKADGKYALPSELKAIKGTIKGNERGYAFFIPENRELKDFFIPNGALGGAMHKDTVFAVKTYSDMDRTDEAKVIKVLQRGVYKLVGAYVSEGAGGVVFPDDKNYFCDVTVPFKYSLNAKSGDKVVVKITAYPEGKKNPEGEIIEVLGRQFSKDAEEKSIIRSFGLTEGFSERLIAEARLAANKKVEPSNRRDFTDELIITIDGEDAKDLDDAVSVTKNPDGTFKLSVHIADVSHYVPHKSPLDKEAYLRGTSVYFPDSVLPMLPPDISNGVCSLSEKEEKYALSCIMDVDMSGGVTNYEVVQSIIKTDSRMTYTAVSQILGGDKEQAKRYSHLIDMIGDMKELANILIAKRTRRGSVDLDMKEARIYIGADGKTVVEAAERTIAHRIIEEFMILANETVAEYMFHLKMPFIYRVHDKPTEEKLTDFAAYVRELGLKVKWNKENVHSSDFQAVLTKLEGTPLFSVINRVMLRSMSKAKYHPVNIGHFGLSSSYYCHFTSPIRRYPDLVIHRIIKLVISGRAGEAMNIYKNFVADAALSASERERNADEAERAMDDLYKARYMQERIGEEFEGVISGVTSFGVFVELENTVEGLVRLDSLPDKHYVYDEKRFVLKGNNTVYRLGEPLKIKVAGVDLMTRKIEFTLPQI